MPNSTPPPFDGRRRSQPALSDEARANELLAEEASVEIRTLIRYELDLAREQTAEAVQKAHYAALIGASAVALSVLALSSITVALLLALGASAVPALVVAALMTVTGAVGAGYTYFVLPHSPLEYARALLKTRLGEVRREIDAHKASPQRS